MPKLVLFAVCEKVILDAQNNASLINLVYGIEAGNTLQGPNLGPIPKNALAPTSWSIFSSWKPTGDDPGKEFVQKLQILYPDGTEFIANDAVFKLEANKNHQNTVNVMGFPVGQVGEVTIKIWLEGDRKRLGEIHSWTVIVTHKQPVN